MVITKEKTENIFGTVNRSEHW